MMTYKGYSAVAELDDEAGIFHGEVIDIKDVVTFQGASVKELKKAFEDSVDDYLAFCAERGEEPDKPFSGQFLVRTEPTVDALALAPGCDKNHSMNGERWSHLCFRPERPTDTRSTTASRLRTRLCVGVSSRARRPRSTGRHRAPLPLLRAPGCH